MAELSSEILEELLFPNGVENAPDTNALIGKFKNKTLTVRDALIIHAQDTGIRFDKHEVVKNITTKQMQELLPDEGKKKPTRAGGFVTKVKKFKEILDRNFFDVTYDLNELNKLVGGKDIRIAAQAVDGSTKKFFDANKTAIGGGQQINYPRDPITKVPQLRGGMAFDEVPPPKSIWPQIIQATEEIATDPKYGPTYAKAFFLSAILPIRGNDITQMTVSKKFAAGLETVRPNLSINADGVLTLSLESMLGRGQKGLPRRVVLTPFLDNLLRADYDDAIKSKRNYLFNIETLDADGNIIKGKDKLPTTTKLSEAAKVHFAPLMKEFEYILGREVVGLKDLRKIASSTIAMHPRINNPEIAVELLGHTGDKAFIKGASKMDAKSYISNIAGVGAEDKITNVLALYESLIADTLEYSDVNDLARNSGISLADETLHIEKIENTGQKQETRIQTSEEIAEAADKRKIQHKLYLAGKEKEIGKTKLEAEESLLKAAEMEKERRAKYGDNQGPEVDKLHAKSSPFLQKIAQMAGIPEEELVGLTTEEIKEKVNKKTKTKITGKDIGKLGFTGGIAALGLAAYGSDPASAAGQDIAYLGAATGAKVIGLAGGPAVTAGMVAAEAFTPSVASDDVQDLVSDKTFMEMGRISELTGESPLDVNTKAQALADVQDVEAQVSRATEGGSFEHPQITREKQANRARLEQQLFDIGLH